MSLSIKFLNILTYEGYNSKTSNYQFWIIFLICILITIFCGLLIIMFCFIGHYKAKEKIKEIDHNKQKEKIEQKYKANSNNFLDIAKLVMNYKNNITIKIFKNNKLLYKGSKLNIPWLLANEEIESFNIKNNILEINI